MESHNPTVPESKADPTNGNTENSSTSSSSPSSTESVSPSKTSEMAKSKTCRKAKVRFQESSISDDEHFEMWRVFWYTHNFESGLLSERQIEETEWEQQQQVQSATPKTQQSKPKSSQSLKSLKSNPSIRIQKDDLKEPSLISVKEKVLTPKEMTPKGDDSKKVQAKSKQPIDKQMGSEEAHKDHQPELKITSEKTPSKSSDETVPAQSENPKEEVSSEPLKDKTSVTKAPKEEHPVSSATAETSEKQPPKKTEHESTPKADSEDSRKTPTPTTKPHSEDDPSVVKLQSSMTAFNHKPETVGAPFETVQVQPSDEKVPHSASNMPLQKAIDIEQAEHSQTMDTAVPFKLEPGLEALRLLDEPEKVDVAEPSMKKANDNQPEADQVELQEKPSSPQSAAPVPPIQLDLHLKFYYHQEANLRSLQTCYGNEISTGNSTADQNVPIKSESELISRQEILMHEGDAFLEQVKNAPAKPSVAAALPSGPVVRGSQAQPAQAIGSKVKVLMAMAAVAGLFIAAYVVNFI